MTAAGTIRVSREWLELRERADAAARSQDLVAQLLPNLPAGPLVVHDLGSGSGSMRRWLAPLLPGPQHWVLHDRDADLLALAEADGAATRLSDITQLGPGDLAGASLITASALLDLLTADELAAVVRACAGAACPILFTLSVSGRVRLRPADPLDAPIAAAFDEHQRRVTLRGRLLGPDAAVATGDAFHRLGARVIVRPSPWRLDADERDLIVQWLNGWVDAACEQKPELAVEVEKYRQRRLREVDAGRLTVSVGHADLLVMP